MTAREELEGLRRMAELESKAIGSRQTAIEERPIPSNLAVAGQAALKGVAAIPDMFLNAPANLINIGKYIAGDTMEKLGHPIWENMRVTESPNLIRSGLTSLRVLSPEREPVTPGQRILDLAVQSGAGMAVNPSGGLVPTLKGIGMGLASGAASGVTKEATGSDAAALAAGIITPLVLRGTGTAIDSVKQRTLKQAQEAGYVVPPSLVKPSRTAKALETIGGKAAISQESSVRNQQVTNQLAAKSLGLPPETPLTPEALSGVRQQAAAVYDKVDELRPTIAMEWFPRFHETNLGAQLRQAKAQATQLWKDNQRAPMESTREAARKMDALADSLEDDIARIAKASGQPALKKELDAARTLFAKSYDVERALIPGTGDVSAAAIGNLMKKKRLTDELSVIGAFAKAFPRESRNAVSVPSPAVDGTNAAMSAMLGTAGYGAVGGPAGLIAAGAPLLRSPARAMALSRPYQHRLLAQPMPLSQAGLAGALTGRSLLEQQ